MRNWNLKSMLSKFLIESKIISKERNEAVAAFFILVVRLFNVPATKHMQCIENSKIIVSYPHVLSRLHP